MKPARGMIAVLLLASVATLSGCGATDPSRFYVLSALRSEDAHGEKRQHARAVAVGVGPIEVARYLDRPQIVMRTSPNRLDLSEFDKWAEPLADNIARVLSENLSGLLHTDRVLIYPWGATPVDYRVEIRITRFDGQRGGDVLLVSHWTVLKERGAVVLASRKSRFSRPIAGGGLEAVAVAMSEILEQLSREIAATITNAESPTPTPSPASSEEQASLLPRSEDRAQDASAAVEHASTE